jgi:hypothetical protein
MSGTMLARLAIVLAALCGVAGVLVYAAAAHMAGPGEQQRFALSSAAVMLLVNAAVAVGLVGVMRVWLPEWRWPAIALVMLAGTALFSASIVVPNMTDYEATLFVNAGPIGATIVIAAWALAALNVLIARSAATE